jgi:hypothetical protein
MIERMGRGALRLWAAGLLLAAGLPGGAGAAVSVQDKPAAAGAGEKRNGSTMKASDDGIESLDKTVLQVGGAEVTLTVADLKAIRDALLEYLKQSQYEDRDPLIRRSGGPAWIDPQGTARIGPWVLGVDGNDIYLRYREPPGQLAGKAHKAIIEKKDGAWTIRRLDMERIRVQR